MRMLELAVKNTAQNSVRKPTECGSEGNSFIIQVSLNVYYVFCSTLKVMENEGGTVVKESLANAGDARDEGSVSGLGRFPGEGNGNPLQYSCLEDSMDRGGWGATVRGVTKSQTRLSTHAC